MDKLQKARRGLLVLIPIQLFFGATFFAKGDNVSALTFLATAVLFTFMYFFPRNKQDVPQLRKWVSYIGLTIVALVMVLGWMSSSVS
ncbi:hypothetical protein [Vibrio profundi]|uniref:hypothetical protein n=1 Tax=Vibrio profundi TaxID=1774960 RepID=UPI0037352972